MKNSIKLFNALQGQKVSRNHLEKIFQLSVEEGQDHITNRLNKLFATYPEGKRFELNIGPKVSEHVNESQLQALGIPFMAQTDADFIGAEDEHKSLGKKFDSSKIYNMITDKIINVIENSGHLPWSSGRKASKENKKSAIEFDLGSPTNFSNGKNYRGINATVLSLYPVRRINPFEVEYDLILDGRLFWMTFKQIIEAGGKLKKGAIANQAVYYNFQYYFKGDKITEKKYIELHNKLSCNTASQNEDCKSLFKTAFLKYYSVFNERDIEGIDFEAKRKKLKDNKPEIESSDQKILAADLVIKNMPKKPSIKTKFIGKTESPHYSPGRDHVVMPLKDQYDDVSVWYGTAFHELIHATGHKSRLYRKDMAKYAVDINARAFEELIAELGSSFLNAESGILLSTLKKNAAYIRGWNKSVAKILKEDNKAIFKASSAAQKAADYILDRNKDGEPKYYKEYEKIIAEIKAKGKAQANKKSKDKTTEAGNEGKSLDFVLNNLSKKHERSIFTGDLQSLNKLTKFSDQNLSVAAQNMLDLIKEGHFYLENFKNGYERNSTKPVYRNIPTYVAKRITIKTLRALTSEKVKFILDQLKGFDYETAWNDYDFTNHGDVKFNINKISKFLREEKPKAHKVKKSKNTIADEQLSLFGYVQTEILDIKNPLKGKTVEELKSISKKTYKGYVGKSVKNVSENINIHFSNVGLKETLWHNRKSIDSRLVLTISKLPQVLKYAKLLKSSEPKPSHINKYKANKILSFEGKIRIDGTVDYYVITVIETPKKNFKYFIERASIKKSIRTRSSNLKKHSALPNGQDKITKKKETKKLGSVVIPIEPKPMAPVADEGVTGVELVKSIEVVNPELVSPILNKSSETESPIMAKVKDRPKNSFVQGIGAAKSKASNISYFNLTGDFAEFLGPLEQKLKHSVVITLDAPPGSGKTRSMFQFLNLVASNGYSAVFVSLEEHPESKLFADKASEYIEPRNEPLINVAADLPPTYNEFIEMIKDHDVIVVDSWNKVYETYQGIDFDKDLRKRLDGKIIAAIFQRTTNGTMRGGAKAAFDGDVILEVVKDDDFRKSYLRARKNRYQDKPLHELGYNFYHKKLINPELLESENEVPFEMVIE